MELPKNIGSPATAALTNIGVHSLQQLTVYTEEDIAKLHGVGLVAIERLKHALKAVGLAFKAVDWKSKQAEAYIQKLDPKKQVALQNLRQLVHELVPEAREQFSYMVPVFTYNGMLVGYGANKNGCSFYVMDPPLVKASAKLLKGYKASGSTVHFSPEKPLPKQLVATLVLARVETNQIKHAAKNKRSN